MDDGAQVGALDVLHGDELHAIGFAQVVDADDVAVRDLRGEDELLLEAVDDGRVAGVLAADGLESDYTVKLDVTGLVDGSHAAFAKECEDFVALAEDISRFEKGLSPEERITASAAER
jgi:hypothetical protein